MSGDGLPVPGYSVPGDSVPGYTVPAQAGRAPAGLPTSDIWLFLYAGEAGRASS
jgi:hypothetical protein